MLRMEQRLPTSSDCHSGGAGDVPAPPLGSRALPVCPPFFPASGQALPAPMLPQVPSTLGGSSWSHNAQYPNQSVLPNRNSRLPVGDGIVGHGDPSPSLNPTATTLSDAVSRPLLPSDSGSGQQQQPSPPNTSLPMGIHIRQQHSVNPDGSWSVNTDEEEVTPMTSPHLKRGRSIPPAELADIAVVDPGHAKRIIDNRQTAAKVRQKRMRDSLENEQGLSEKQHIEAQQQQLQDQSAQHQQLQMEHLHLQMEHQQLQTNHHQFQENLQLQLQGQIQLTLLLHDEQRQIAQQLQQQQLAIRQLQQEQLAIRQLQQEHIQSTVRLSESWAGQRRLEQQVYQLVLIVQQLNQQVHRQQEQQVLLLQHFQQQQVVGEVPRGPVTSNTGTNANVGNMNSSPSKEDN